jgi:hypothetical protein
MSSFQTRQPKGIGTGGQYAALAHNEPELALSPVDVQELASPVEMPVGSLAYLD